MGRTGRTTQSFTDDIEGVHLTRLACDKSRFANQLPRAEVLRYAGGRVHGIVGSYTSTGRSRAIAAAPVDAPAKERAADGAPALQHRALAREALTNSQMEVLSSRLINQSVKATPSLPRDSNLM